MAIQINYDKCCYKDGACSSCGCGCDSCSGCVESCPTGALSRNKILEIDESKCLDCGACIASCKNGALSF